MAAFHTDCTHGQSGAALTAENVSLWRHREFGKLWAASAISDFGSEVSALALPLIAALTLGATAWQMGLLSAAATTPVLLVGLFAGVWVDRLRRRRVMIWLALSPVGRLQTLPARERPEPLLAATPATRVS